MTPTTLSRAYSVPKATATATRDGRPRRQTVPRPNAVAAPNLSAGEIEVAIKTPRNDTDGRPNRKGLALSGKRNEELSERELRQRTDMERRVHKRYRYLKDEYTIGEAVRELLERDRYEEALYMTRLASKHKPVTVSWNHVLKYTFREGSLRAGIKLYQEMKKRGQVPSAQTYTLIFNGCRKSKLHEQAVLTATKIYYGMLADDRLRPNTIHMNAVLDTCAHAHDLQAVFNIAKTANTSYRKPDNATYTTILNAMRNSTERHHQQLVERTARDLDTVHPDLERPEVTVRRARATWEEIVANWRRGFLVMDERLTCAMGRILLLGAAYDNLDVLALVNQTMGVPRLDRELAQHKENSRLGAVRVREKRAAEATPTPKAEVEAEAEASEAEAETEMAAKPEAATETETAETETEAAETETTTGTATNATNATPTPPTALSEASATGTTATTTTATDKLLPGEQPTQFKPVAVQASDKVLSAGSSALMYPRPGPNTLSLVMSAIGGSRRTSLAMPYWRLLTGPSYGIVPDSENCFRLLRTLKRGHASTDAVEAMLTMPREVLAARSFQVAMDVCVANTLALNAFQSAGKLLDLMTRTLRVPDAYTLKMYLQVALGSNRHFRNAKTETDRVVGKVAFGKQLVRALDRLWDPVRQLGNELKMAGELADATAVATTSSSGASGSSARPFADVERARTEYAELLRLMVATTDMIVSEEMADADTLKSMRTARNLLNRQVSNFYTGRPVAKPEPPRDARLFGAAERGPRPGVES